MTLTYQQQFVLDGLAGRAAILDLDARYNRLYSAGDLAGWISHVPSRGGVVDAGGGDIHRSTRRVRRRQWSAIGHRRPRDQPLTVLRRPNNVSRCCSATANCGPPAHSGTASSTSAAAGTSRRANSSGTSSHGRVRCRCERRHQLRVRLRHLRRRGSDGRHAHRAEVRGQRGQRRPIQHFASMVRDANPAYWDAGIRQAGVGRDRRTTRAADRAADAAALGTHR